MQYSFKKILIPIDLTINSEVSIKKALELADPDTTIHLVYVEDSGISRLFTSIKKYFTGTQNVLGKEEIKEKMDQLKSWIEENSIGMKAFTRIISGDSIQSAIEQQAIQYGIDLIIIGKNSNHPLFPFFNSIIPSRLNKKTGIAVLTITPGALRHKVKKLVIPVSGNDSLQDKMEMISTLCRKFRLNIHLLTFMNRNTDGTDRNVSSFLHAYQYLKVNSQYPLEYAILYGNNKAKAILKYAEKINADILLVHPGSETKIGWPNKNISDMLPATSRMQVLAV